MEVGIHTSFPSVAGPVKAVARLSVSVAGVLVSIATALVFIAMSFSTSSHQLN